MIHLFLILVVKGIGESMHFDLKLLIFSFFSNPAIVTFFFKISDENLKFLRVEIYSVFVFSCIFIFSSQCGCCDNGQKLQRTIEMMSGCSSNKSKIYPFVMLRGKTQKYLDFISVVLFYFKQSYAYS